MLKTRLEILKREKESKEKRSVPWSEIAQATGISVQVLSNLASRKRPAVTNTRHLEALCRYFTCSLDDLMEFSPPLRSPRKVSCHIEKLYPGYLQAGDDS
jgi:putative transcriptional regulator